MRTRFIHPSAVVDDGACIGEGTRVWAFSHILAGAIVGSDCNICDHAFLEGGLRIGQRVTIKCGVSLWNGLTLEDDVFVGPGGVFTNDKRPRSRKYSANFLKTELRQGSSIGANSTILPGLTIGCWAMVGACAVVTRSVPDYALVFGNPARMRGWVCRCGGKLLRISDSNLACSCGLAYQQNGENEVMETKGSVKASARPSNFEP